MSDYKNPQGSSNRKGLPADEARALCDKVLNMSGADNARVTIQSGWRGFTRIATNKITTSGGSDNLTVNIMSAYGKRTASVTSNGVNDAALQDAVKRSEEFAKIAPENPEYLPELGTQEYSRVGGYYNATGDMAPDARAIPAAETIEKAKMAGTVAAGYMDVRAGSRALATSNGLFAHHASTGVASTLTIRTPDGSSSGWAGDEANDWRRIENERIADTAISKCIQWKGKTSLEPGEYTAVLEPTAVGMLMLRMLNAFNRRTADEGRSYFSKPGGGNRIGEQLFDKKVTIVSDPAMGDFETAPFNGQGLPIKRKMWVQNGVLQDLSTSRYWAQQQNIEPLAGPSNFIMSGGSDSLQDMIRSTNRGVLITRFWYIRGLNPRIMSYTGLTRDGTFLIENGRISRPVNNFRFNQSLADFLKNVEMIGTSKRVAAGENSSVGTPVVVPAMKFSKFNLSSVSDAI